MTDVPSPATSPLTVEECHHCGALVPVGSFCGNCGAHLAERAGGGARLHAFAAAPDEHVGHATVISTLFPHLSHHHAHAFRQVFVAGLAVTVILAALRLYAPATIVAALLLPVLYLLYLYEVEVYEHEPLLVIAATFVLGAALGAGFTLLVGHETSAGLAGNRQGVVISGVLIPLVAQLLMVACPLLLLSRTHFDETLDGLTFGVATALGFTMASVIAGFWYVLTAPLQGSALSSEDILRLLRAGVIVALVNASTTGMISAAIWTLRHRRSRGRHLAPWRRLPATAAIAFGAQIVLGVVSYYVSSLLGLVILWAVAAVLLLIWLRVLLHHALLDEGAEHLIGEASACAECHRLVPTMLFCPACGVARSAAPKHSRPAGAVGAPAIEGTA